MKHSVNILISFMILAFMAGTAWAQTNVGAAVKHGSQAGSHASRSVIHAIIGSGQVVSAAASVPLSIAGSAGAVSAQIAHDLRKAASTPIGQPLEISDETVSVGLPPDMELNND